MDKATLVGIDVEAGKNLLKLLDGAEFKVVAALWLLLPEFADWRLWIASPVVDAEGIRAAYRKIYSAWRTVPEADSIDFAQINAVSPKNPLIRELRRRFGKTASVEGMRLGGHTIGDRFVEDAYVYRIKR